MGDADFTGKHYPKLKKALKRSAKMKGIGSTVSGQQLINSEPKDRAAAVRAFKKEHKLPLTAGTATANADIGKVKKRPKATPTTPTPTLQFKRADNGTLVEGRAVQDRTNTTAYKQKLQDLTGKKKEEIVSHIKNKLTIKHNGVDHLPTVAALEKMLGKTKFDKVLQTFGGDRAALEKAIQQK